MQLIQVMRLTYIIKENKTIMSKPMTGKANKKFVATSVEKDGGSVYDWEEKDIILRSCILGTLIEERKDQIVCFSTAK